MKNVIDGIFSASEWDELIANLKLSSQQALIMRGLFIGMSDKQIAKKLGISVSTVRTHFTRLFDKYGVEDRNSLILLIFKQFRQSCREKACPRTNSELQTAEASVPQCRC